MNSYTVMPTACKLKQNFFRWDYGLSALLVRAIGCAAIAAHLLFFFGFPFTFTFSPAPVGRILVVMLFLPLLLYPKQDWSIAQKVYFEGVLALGIPGFFTYMLLMNGGLYWAVSLIFGVFFYATFVRWQMMVWLYPLAVAGAFGLAGLLTPGDLPATEDVMRLQGIVILTMVLVQGIRTLVEEAHLETARLKRKADQQNEIFSALLDISVEVSRFDDLDEIFHLLLKRFETIFPSRGFGLLVEGPRPKIIPHMAFRGISQKDSTFLLEVHPYVLGFANVGTVNDEEIISSIEGDDWQVFGGGIRSSSIHGQAVYCFKLFIKGRSLDEDERRTLEVFLETIRGMTRSRIQALELERFSNTDHLTGLYNRSYFDRVLAQWQDKARSEKPFAVVFGDINGLKRINDTYGHPAGDMMIKSSANLLIQVARTSDMVFRLGGDEVVILCPTTTREEAAMLVDRIKQEMASLRVACVDEVSGQVTEEDVHISFGVASSNEQGPLEVVLLADKRMFEEKNRYYEKGTVARYR